MDALGLAHLGLVGHGLLSAGNVRRRPAFADVAGDGHVDVTCERNAVPLLADTPPDDLVELHERGIAARRLPKPDRSPG